jgi:uncharacterized protein (TIGR02246 family)
VKSDPLEIIKYFIQAINRHDVPALLDLMTPDHRFVDSLGNKIEGLQKLSAVWEGYFQMVPDYHLDIQNQFVSGNDVALFGTAGGTFSVAGTILPENGWSTLVAIRATVVSHQIREWQICADNEPIRAVMRRNPNATGG